MSHNHSDEYLNDDTGEPVRTLSPRDRVPLYILISAMGLASYGTVLYLNLTRNIDSKVSKEQITHWRDDMQDLNPSIKIPRIPAVNTAVGWWEPKDVAKAGQLTLR